MPVDPDVLAKLSTKPGVYLFRDARAGVLYVGKAKSLRPRVRSYFQRSADLSAKNRELMGATNPQDAAPGTIRADHAKTVDENAVHGSDGPDTAAEEIAFFFAPGEICPRTR